MSRRRKTICTSILTGVTIILPGCYSRVVDAHGPNANSYDIYEPANRDNVIDRTIDDWFGTGEPPKNR